MYDSSMYKRPPGSPKRPCFPVAQEGGRDDFTKSGSSSLSGQFQAQVERLSAGAAKSAHGTTYLGGFRRIGLDVTVSLKSRNSDERTKRFQITKNINLPNPAPQIPCKSLISSV